MDTGVDAAAHLLADHLAASGEDAGAFAVRAGIERSLLDSILSGGVAPDLMTARRISAASGGAIGVRQLIAAADSVILVGGYGGAIDDRLLAAVIEVVAPETFPPDCTLAAFVATVAADTFAALTTVSGLSRQDRLAEALRPGLRENFARIAGRQDDPSRPDAAAREAARLYFAAEARLAA